MTPQQDTNVRMVAVELRRAVTRLGMIDGPDARIVAGKVAACALLLESSLDADPYDLLDCADQVVDLADAPTTAAAVAGDQSGPAGP